MKLLSETRVRIRETFGGVSRAVKLGVGGRSPMVFEADEIDELRNEEIGWTRLSGRSSRDLEEWSQKRMLDVAWYLYRKNHMARRIVGMVEDFTVGDGIITTAEDDNLASLVAEFWDDPINAMDQLNGQRSKEWSLWGEICMPVSVHPMSGVCRLGWVDPVFIDQVHPGINGRAQVIELTDDGAEQVGQKELTNVYWNDEEGRLEGDCFFRAINTCLGGRRGVSDLYTAADWIEALEDTQSAAVDRAQLMNSFVWDVTLKGMSEDAIRTWLQKGGAEPPGPASVQAHNESVEWNAIVPQLGAYEMSRHFKDLRAYILGGLGIPNHWYGSGDDANLATAAVMAEPTRKMLKRKQKEFRFLLTDILKFQIQTFQAAGRTSGIKDDDLSKFEVTIPDFSGPDIAKVGASVAQLLVSIKEAEENGWVTHKTAASLASTVFSEIGAEIDPEAELAAIEDEEKEREKNEDEDALAGEEEKRQALLKAIADKRATMDDPAAVAAAAGGADE